ncbi:hypothetical protein J4229_01975 [Candidatus Pacearchaeota archaeon]|nr:hypothetical protein [Candidatus Pacearchaeota archaeon]
MEISKITDIILAIVSFGAGILSLLNEKYRPAGAALLIAGFILIYFSSYTAKINEQEREIKKLKEKLKIHERMISMEADILALKNKVFK